MRWVAFASTLIPAALLAQGPGAPVAVPVALEFPAPPAGAEAVLPRRTRPAEIPWLDLEASAEAQVRTPPADSSAKDPEGRPEALPDSPGAAQSAAAAVPCASAPVPVGSDPRAVSASSGQTPCSPKKGTYRQFLNSPAPLPLTPRQKGILAVRDVVDPFELMTITLNAAFTVGINSHNPYGPGLPGFGREIGYSLVQDATGEFLGTFMMCSLVSQDPHYHRDPGARPARRLVHALEHTIISQHDNGRRMPNYENFVTYPASAEIANLYIPGVHSNGPSTVARFMTGLATDPVNNIITEFLPDFARHIHIQVVFVQQILNQIATGQM